MKKERNVQESVLCVLKGVSHCFTKMTKETEVALRRSLLPCYQEGDLRAAGAWGAAPPPSADGGVATHPDFSRAASPGRFAPP